MRKTDKNTENIILNVIASAGLLITLVPSFLNWQGFTGPENVNTLMVIGTVLWFGSASFLLGRKQPDSNAENT